MTIINPTPIATLPPAPIKGAAGFGATADTFVGALQPFGVQVNAVGAATYQNALESKSSAEIATAAAALVGVAAWSASINNYAVGDKVISPLALLNQTYPVYVCKVATAGTHIDPYSDATHWSMYNPTLSALNGGQASAGSVQLTASSPYVQSVSSAGYGVAVTMPDATTVSAGAKWQIQNAGSFDIRILDYSGGLLGFLKGGESSTVGLAVNSTSAGVWSCTGLSKIGVKGFVQALSSVQNLVLKYAIKLTATKTLFLIGVNSGALYAVAYDTATQTQSNTLTCRATHSLCSAVKITDSTALLVSHDGTSTLQSAVITVAGDGTLSLGTVANDTVSAPSAFGQFLAVGTSFVLSYYRGGGYLKAFLTTSGIVSVGVEVSVGNADGYAPSLYIGGSIVRAISVISGYIKCIPYTASGSTLTAGTSAQPASAVNGLFRGIKNDNGNIFAIYQNGANWIASCFKLTGTVEAVTTANISVCSDSSSNMLNDFEVIKNGNKLLFCGRGSTWATAPNVFYVNVITDTNGTVSCGTAISESIGYSNILIQCKSKNGFAFCSTSYVSYFQNYIVNYNWPGTSPVRLLSIPQNGNGNTSVASTSDRFCIASPSTFFNASAFYYIINSTIMPIYEFSDSGISMKVCPSDFAYYNVNFYRGYFGDNEGFAHVPTMVGTNNGITIKMLEVI